MTEKKSTVNIWMMTTLVLVVFIVGFVVGNFQSNDADSNLVGVKIAKDKGDNKKVTPTKAVPNKIISADDIDIKGEPFLGDANAPVTIVEYSDFQCPFCGKFFKNTFPQLKSEYIDTGKVRFVYKDFPLGFHKQAVKAAESANCAGDQDRYWAMHDMIFENSSDWSNNDAAVSVFKGFATKLDLNQSEFDNCLDSGRYITEIEEDYAEGAALGVSGTPGFFINGQKLIGAQPFSAFKPIIDAKLAE